VLISADELMEFREITFCAEIIVEYRRRQTSSAAKKKLFSMIGTIKRIILNESKTNMIIEFFENYFWNLCKLSAF